MASTIYSVFKDRASSTPRLTALLTPGKSDTTFGELLDRTELTRATLAQFGIKRGDRVGILAPTRDAMAAAYLAVVTLATAAPLSAHSTAHELEFSVADFGVSALIIEDRLSDLQQKASALGVKVISLVPDRSKAGIFGLRGQVVDEHAEPSPPMPDDISHVLHTSGTSARPKIVPRTHARQAASATRDRGELQLRPGDRVINVMPLHHTEGIHQFTVPLIAGVSIVFAEFDPSGFIALIEKYQPTTFTMVPSMHRMVVETVRDRRALFTGTSLRYIETSSAALPVSLQRQMKEVYGVPVIQGYGATEVGGMASLGLSQDDVPEGSVGKRRHAGVVIMDEVGNVLPPMTRGEICVKRPDTVQEYENNPQANVAAFRDGYYRTGDEGYLDENDYLFVLGRIGETINRGGEKIAPLEVDEVLLAHKDVLEAAAFAVDHPGLGQEVWAAVVPKHGAVLDPAEVRAFVSRSLSFPRVPKRIFVVEKLPHNEIGKVMRRELSEKFGSQSRAGS